MKALLQAALFCLLAGSVSAAPGASSYQSFPAGTVGGNPSLYQAGPAVPHAMTFGTIGHLAVLKAADMTKTTDQPAMMLIYGMTPNYLVTSVYAANCTSTPAGAVGGIYTAATKAGTQIIAAAQTYAVLTTPTAVEPLTNNATTTMVSANQLYLSLTTGASAGTPVCDIYIDGIGLE